MPLPVPASVKLKSMFGQCLNWKHQRIWRPKATGLARRLAYGCVGKLRPLQSERQGPAEDSSIFHVQLAGWWWYIQGEQQMATPESNTCAPQLAGWWGHGWTQLLAFERYTGVWERDVPCHSPTNHHHRKALWIRHSGRPCLGTCLALPDSLWLPCTPLGPDRSTGGGGWIADASFDALPRSILPFWLGSAAICILQ